jgi:hypothetical protein
MNTNTARVGDEIASVLPSRPANIIDLYAVVIADNIWFLEEMGAKPHWTNKKNLLTARRFLLTDAAEFVELHSDRFGSDGLKPRLELIVNN